MSLLKEPRLYSLDGRGGTAGKEANNSISLGLSGDHHGGLVEGLESEAAKLPKWREVRDVGDVWKKLVSLGVGTDW